MREKSGKQGRGERKKGQEKEKREKKILTLKCRHICWEFSDKEKERREGKEKGNGGKETKKGERWKGREEEMKLKKKKKGRGKEEFNLNAGIFCGFSHMRILSDFYVKVCTKLEGNYFRNEKFSASKGAHPPQTPPVRISAHINFVAFHQ